MTLRKRVGATTLRGTAEDGLQVQLSSLLDAVASYYGIGKGLADGVVIQFGWSLLRLRAEGGELIVCEPDFGSDRLYEFRDDLTSTIQVTRLQSSFVSSLGVEPQDIRFDDKVVFRKGSFSHPRIYAHRTESAPGDSGWYIGPADGADGPPPASELEACWAYQLLRLRPSLVAPLWLPTEFIVVLNGPEITNVINPAGVSVWPRRGEE